MAAPTFVAAYTGISFTSNSTNKSTSITTQAGDLVVVCAGNENTSGEVNTPSGNGITFTQKARYHTGNAPVYIWAGTDTTGGTGWTLSMSIDFAQYWGATILVFRNAVAGAATTDFKNDGTYTTSLTTTADNSAIATIINDWDANSDSGSSRVWSTINGYTPSTGNNLETAYVYQNGAYTVFDAYYPDTGTTGAKTVGMSTAPTHTGTPHITLAAIEIQGVTPPSAVPTGWFTFNNSADPALINPSNFYGRYDFTGDTSNDVSGNGNDAEMVQGYTATADRNGAPISAYTFNGNNGYAFTYNSFVNPQTYSANVWFNTITTAGGALVGFGNGQFTSMGSFDRMIYMDTSGRLNFGVYDGTATHVIRSASSYNDGKWHMATMVMNTSTGMRLYVDGTSVGTDANTISEAYTGWWHIGYNNTAGWSNSSGSDNFPGTLDDVWIYKIALTAAQVTQLYTYYGIRDSNDQTLTAGASMYGWYDFTGGSLTDISGNGNTAQLNPSYSAATDRKGVASNAYTFDGSEGFAYTTKSFANPTTFSANAWFKINNSNGGLIVGFANTQTNNMTKFDRVMYMGTDGKVYFGTYDLSTYTAHIINSTSTYNNGSWHMATMVMSSTSGMKLYVDGINVATDSNTICDNYTGWWHLAYSSMDGWTNGGDGFFGGTLDDVRIYRIALTASQISRLYSL